MNDAYTDIMGRNQSEAQRLDEQFELLTRNIGYLLHPSITNRLSTSPTIADVGTGTGLFLENLAAVYPRGTFRGFDVSQELYPPSASLPPNVELCLMDVKAPPPLAERHRYDVVHVRLLTAAMTPLDWEIVVSNLLQLLKPGGALQWEECNFAGGRHLRGEANSTVSAARFMGSLFREQLKDRLSHGWNTLPRIMRTAGLVQVDEDIVSSDRLVETRGALTANGMLAVFDWAKLMSRRGASGSCSMDDLKSLEVQAEQDIRSGCYVRFDIHIVLGFRSG